jgi:hypothetical protein
MVVYNCEGCLFYSKQKNDYNRHLKTKKHQSNVGNSLIPMVMSTNEHKMSTNEHKMSTNEHKMSTNNLKYMCDFCDDNFNTKANKRRHELHYCKENTSIMTHKIKKLEREKNKLEKKIEKMLDKTCTINNNTTNNNSNTFIVVNNYGKENTEYLTAEKIVQLLNRPYDSIQDLIKMLHFNADHPENHNVKITNKKEPFALVWNDPIWELRKKKTVVKDMVDKGYMMIDNTHDEVSNDTKENKKYLKFQNNFEDSASNIKELIEDETEIMIINETKKIEKS